MRETILRNCAFIYGLVVYTGSDTKIQMSNSDGEARSKLKTSSLMRDVNRFLIYMVLFQCMLCIGGAMIASVWHRWYASHMWFLGLEYDTDKSPSYGSAMTGFIAFWTWYILLSQMVPISLIVSSEMVKFAQSIFIQWDKKMYSAAINKAAHCNSSTVHEDLGLVEYVLLIFDDLTRSCF